MKKTIGIIILFSALSSLINAQNNSFIYMENEKFFQGCEEFYPMIMNYSISYEDSAGSLRITSPMNQCEKIQGCNSCGVSRQDYRDKIASHLETIAVMGFNTLRIVGLTVRYDDQKDSEGDFTGNLISNSYYEFGKSGPNKLHCHKYNKKGISLNDMNDFKRQGDLFAQLFDIIREENIPLKVILVTGGHGIEMRSETYRDYLKYLADRFSGEPILFAYDLYNEPQYSEKVDPRATNKYDRANWFNGWYKVIKEKAPWHFVTYGPVLTDIFGWDPEVMPCDFFAYHIYSPPRKNCNWSYDTAFISYKVNLKYASENFSKPWILGETGLSGINPEVYANYKINPVVSSEEEQRAFMESSLKYVKWYGIGGYALWMFKDVIWSFKNMDTKVAKQYFMGVVHYRENNDWKPAAYEFAKFDPTKTCSDCTHPLPDHYYNSYFYPYTLVEGSVFSRHSDRDRSAIPFKDALIRVTIGKSGTKDFNHPFLTFSDARGRFTIRSLYKDNDMVVKQIRISAPSMSQYYKANWAKGLTFNSPFYLYPLDPDSIPQVLHPEDRKILTRGKKILWDKKRLLLEKTLVLKKGVQLTITDTLYVKSGTRIEVRNGALLEIDKGAIIGLCQWEGIDVLESGEKDNSRKKSSGKVILSNGATIKNSRYGVRKINSEGDVIEQGENVQYQMQ